jgi:hypothetical protein
MEQRKTLYLSFQISEPINLKEKSFAISVCQQGDRLANRRPENRAKKFSPTPFSIVLLSQEGELIEAGFD